MIRPSEDPVAAPEPQAPESTAVGVESGGSDEHCTFHLDRFEGPLDLLLYLIQRDEMDIYDIPIARITQQYLTYIDLLDVFDLDNAGEFLVMAATLMRIKARLLLPVQKGEDDDDEVDPRDELVRRLLEYKKYKEAAQSFGEKEESRSDWFYRGTQYPYVDLDQEPPEFTLSMFDLLGALRNVLDQIEGDHTHHVYQEVFTVDQQSAKILDLLGAQARLRFEEVFEGARTKMQVVVTFVAMLELMKQQRIRAQQILQYGEIWISANENPEAPEADTGEDAKEQADAS